MSVVVGIKKDGVVYLGADTMATLGDSKRWLTNEHSQKIWAVEDLPNAMMGGVGLLRDLNVVRYCTDGLIPEIDIIKDTVSIRTIMENAAPIIMQSVDEYCKAICLDREMGPSTGLSNFFLAQGEHLFMITGDGYVDEIEDCDAIGSGADSALASLSNTVGEEPEVRIYKALHASSTMDVGVGAPYVIMNNRDLKLCFFDVQPRPIEATEATEEVEKPKAKHKRRTPKSEI